MAFCAVIGFGLLSPPDEPVKSFVPRCAGFVAECFQYVSSPTAKIGDDEPNNGCWIEHWRNQNIKHDGSEMIHSQISDKWRMTRIQIPLSLPLCEQDQGDARYNVAVGAELQH